MLREIIETLSAYLKFNPEEKFVALLKKVEYVIKTFKEKA